MVNADYVYPLESTVTVDEVRYFFVSHGEQDLIKTIRFKQLGTYLERPVFNLGFGNYDIENDVVTDEETSNNGDAYYVFNTVLSTIPAFFQSFPEACLLVRGSDSYDDFPAQCRPNCVKNCPPERCRNYRRRIQIYSNYVHKYWDLLNVDYEFLGVMMAASGEVETEPYDRAKKYDAILTFRKNS